MVQGFFNGFFIIVPGALKILSKHWELMERNKDKLLSAASMPLENYELKKLKNHIPARVDGDGRLANTEIDGRKINDFAEAENPNSWLKQFDSVPLVLHATAEFVKAFGIGSLPEGLAESIRKNIGVMADYIINVYKCPCADVWEQNLHMQQLREAASCRLGHAQKAWTLPMLSAISSQSKRNLSLAPLNKLICFRSKKIIKSL